MRMPERSRTQRRQGTMRRLALPMAMAMVAALGGCAMSITPPQRFDHAAAPDIRTVLVTDPKFYHKRDAIPLSTTIQVGRSFIPVNSELVLEPPTCGVTELDTPVMRSGDGWAGGGPVANRIFTERLTADLKAEGYEVLTPLYDAGRTPDASLRIGPASFWCATSVSLHFTPHKDMGVSVSAELVRQSDQKTLMQVQVIDQYLPPIVLPSYGVLLPRDPDRLFDLPQTQEEKQRVLATFKRMIEQAADVIASFMK